MLEQPISDPCMQKNAGKDMMYACVTHRVPGPALGLHEHGTLGPLLHHKHMHHDMYRAVSISEASLSINEASVYCMDA